MPELSDLFVFIKAVLWKHWIPIVLSLGVPPLIEQSYKRLFGKALPFAVHFRWMAVGGAVVATFLAWNNEYTARIKLEQDAAAFASTRALAEATTRERNNLRNLLRDLRVEGDQQKRDILEKDNIIRTLNTKLADRKRREKISARLGVFLDEGEILKRQALMDTAKPPQIDDAIQWAHRVHHFLSEDVGPAQAAIFRNPPVRPSYSHGKPQEYENLWNYLERELAVIRDFMKQPELGIPVEGQ